MRKRTYFEELFFKLLMLLSTIVVVTCVLSITYTIIRTGWKSMSWSMLTELPRSGFFLGQANSGGLLNAIVGSLYIVGASTLLGLLVSLPVVFYINIYLNTKSKFAYIARLVYDVLFGIPSIVYGAFGFSIMVYLGLHSSLLGGIIVITLLIIPIFIRSMDEIARQLPRDILDVTYSLGATRLEVVPVALRQIAPGIGTATLLSIGRAIGDAAGVMFTAGYTDSIPTSLSQPAATLPLSVFFQLSSPVKAVQDRAYAAALILTVIILLLSIGGRLLTNHFSKNQIK
ncbi:phosphate transport system permease protein PstA [Bacteroidia bacterium]|nr:phosphate transport system permease protein PstA [Bacteroidia bacterium]